MEQGCPARSFRYNGTLCACDPGLYFLPNGTCAGLDVPAGGSWAMGYGVGAEEPTFLTTVLPLDTIRRVTQSQAVLLGATLVSVLVWIAFCFALRFVPIRDGRGLCFRLRWWISRLDAFSTYHWLDDQKVVTKRKTELGGTFSLASWILFIGLFSALLYQIITKRNIEVHMVRPANAPDLLSFVNDMEFNITTISAMSCSQLRGLENLVIGTPGFVDNRVFPLSTYANYYCQNTSTGPMVVLKCNNCQIPRRNYYVSWNFVDLPNNPAVAVGFQFNLTTKSHGDDRHVSFVAGTLKSDSFTNDKPKTLRGPDLNVLKIHLFPQEYNYLHNLKLIQPLFHDFIPGTSISVASDLEGSLQNSVGGVVNIMLFFRYLSDYIVEVDREKVLGPVGFLANVGGLYVLSVGIFLYFLVQCEARIKKLRYEDNVMRTIRSKKRAQCNWDKVRKYVMYTWGPSNLDGENKISKQHKGVMDPCCGIRSSHAIKHPSRRDSMDETIISF